MVMFTSKSGIKIPPVQSADLKALRERLVSEYGISWVQIVEASSYSMAMVVRYALGLSAEGGKVACIFDDCLSGWVSLATVRHLVNAGAQTELIFIGDADTASEELKHQLAPLDKMGQSVTLWRDLDDAEAISGILSTCHNSLCGYFDIGRTPNAFHKAINDLLNDMSTPIYAIECPPGVDPDTGKSLGSPLFASCTMALGAPLVGLVEGFDYVGRYYVCDISLTQELWSGSISGDVSGYHKLFAEQPVQQLLK